MFAHNLSLTRDDYIIFSKTKPPKEHQITEADSSLLIRLNIDIYYVNFCGEENGNSTLTSSWKIRTYKEPYYIRFQPRSFEFKLGFKYKWLGSKHFNNLFLHSAFLAPEAI